MTTAPGLTSYPGGKNNASVWQRIINQIPPHRRYFELFLGSGAIMRHKRFAEFQLGADLDEGALQRFREGWADLQGLYRMDRYVCEWGTAARWREGLAVVKGNAAVFLHANVYERDDFIYLDPPYLYETRRGGSRPIYRHEFGEREEHEQLLQLVLATPARVAISGYPSELYRETLKGWRAVEFQTMSQAGLATECLWCNYDEPTELHDYRYMGVDKGDKQRIRRKLSRWVRRLGDMPLLERRTLLAAMAEAGLLRAQPKSAA